MSCSLPCDGPGLDNIAIQPTPQQPTSNVQETMHIAIEFNIIPYNILPCFIYNLTSSALVSLSTPPGGAHLTKISAIHSDVVRERRGPVQALLVIVAERVQALLLGALEHTRDGVETHVELLDRRAERQADKVVARRREEVAAVRRVDVEEDTGDDDTLLLEELLEERLCFGLVVHGCGSGGELRTRPLLSGAGRCSRFSQT